MVYMVSQGAKAGSPSTMQVSCSLTHSHSVGMGRHLLMVEGKSNEASDELCGQSRA